MALLAAFLFRYIQGATFYRRLHREAVSLLPHGSERTWCDVGCGPGLVARLAAERGYRAMGVDRDPHMIKQAKHLARRQRCSAEFMVASISELASSKRKAHVVSSASLLALSADRIGVTRRLLSCLHEEGVLLVIETTEAMTLKAAWASFERQRGGRRGWVLLLWAWARIGRNSVRESDLAVPGYAVECYELLDGMVAAWIIRRKP